MRHAAHMPGSEPQAAGVPAAHRRAACVRASILLEVLLAIGVFAFAGVVVLATVDEALADGARGARRALAMDLARSHLAALEAGSAGVLDGVGMSASGAMGGGTGASGGSIGAMSDPRAGLRVESSLEPSDFPGLALAVVQVFDDAASTTTAARLAGRAMDDPPRLAVLRQLVRADAAGGGGGRPEFSP